MKFFVCVAIGFLTGLLTGCKKPESQYVEVQNPSVGALLKTRYVPQLSAVQVIVPHLNTTFAFRPFDPTMFPSKTHLRMHVSRFEFGELLTRTRAEWVNAFAAITTSDCRMLRIEVDEPDNEFNPESIHADLAQYEDGRIIIQIRFKGFRPTIAAIVVGAPANGVTCISDWKPAPMLIRVVKDIFNLQQRFGHELQQPVRSHMAVAPTNTTTAPTELKP